MSMKNPTAQGISRLLKAAGFDRSETLSRASLRHRYTAGFHVRGDGADVYVGWRPATPPPPEGDSVAFRERNRPVALEMAGRYAEALRAAGWPAEVIHLAGPLVRVTAKEG